MNYSNLNSIGDLNTNINTIPFVDQESLLKECAENTMIKLNNEAFLNLGWLLLGVGIVMFLYYSHYVITHRRDMNKLNIFLHMIFPYLIGVYSCFLLFFQTYNVKWLLWGHNIYQFFGVGVILYCFVKHDHRIEDKYDRFWNWIFKIKNEHMEKV